MSCDEGASFLQMTFAGASAPALAGYSLGDRSQWRYGTKSDEVLGNYAALGAELDIPCEQMVMPLETHTSNVATVGTADGGGGVLREPELLDVDGVVTDEHGLLLGITICDCAPVFLADEDGRAVGLLHCGWRGTRGGIVAEGIRQMRMLGAEPERMHAVIGPHICERCFEVGDELMEEFADIHTPVELHELFHRRDGRLTLDLTTSIRLQLLHCGLREENVSASSECTYHGESFFSFRRGDVEKRNLAFIMLVAP